MYKPPSPFSVQALKATEETDFWLLVWDLLNDFMEAEASQMYRVNFREYCVSVLAKFVEAALGADALSEDTLEYLDEALAGYCALTGTPLKRAISQFACRGGKQDIDPAHLENLSCVVQPAQRTPEWYIFRSQMLTATAISKLFSTPSKTLAIIREKCEGETERRPLSEYDTRQWGVKYEPVSKAIYELMYKTRVQEYGCIRHRKYGFIGASPDGINVKQSSARYGRMLEIKNIVNREITCEPLEDYWIQMQVQMEVCDLDLCDFVETRIREYDGEDKFYAAYEAAECDFCGVVLQFAGEAGSIHYEYMPLFYRGYEKSAVDEWIRRTVADTKYPHRRTAYWYLDEFSCVVVERNRLWFDRALQRISEVWETILRQKDEPASPPATKISLINIIR